MKQFESKKNQVSVFLGKNHLTADRPNGNADLRRRATYQGNDKPREQRGAGLSGAGSTGKRADRVPMWPVYHRAVPAPTDSVLCVRLCM